MLLQGLKDDLNVKSYCQSDRKTEGKTSRMAILRLGLYMKISPISPKAQSRINFIISDSIPLKNYNLFFHKL